MNLDIYPVSKVQFQKLRIYDYYSKNNLIENKMFVNIFGFNSKILKLASSCLIDKIKNNFDCLAKNFNNFWDKIVDEN